MPEDKIQPTQKLEKIQTFTSKQQAFLEIWKRRKFAKEAMVPSMLEAGYTISSARSMANEFHHHDTPMRRAILKAMNDADFTIEKTVQEHKRIAFEAQHPFRPSQPDNEVRRKAIAMAYDIFDVKPPKKIEVGKADQFDIELDFEDVQRIEAYTGEELLDAEIIEEDEEKEDESIGREDMEPL